MEFLRSKRENDTKKPIVGSRVEVLDDCGHIPQLEQPEQTLALVGDFLQA